MKSKALMLVISLIVSVGLWFYVITVVSPNSEITIANVKVEVTGKNKLQDSSNLIVVSDTENITLDLVISGNRTDLIKLDRSSFIVTADISDIDRAGKGKDVSITVTAPSNVTVKSQSLYGITVDVENLVTNTEVPVELVYDKAELPSGYTIKVPANSYPRFVSVSGPESIMKTVDHAEVVLDLAGRQEGYYEEMVSYILYNKDGKALYDQKKNIDQKLLSHDREVQINLPIYYTKDLELELALKDGGGAKASDAQVKFYIYDPEGTYEETDEISSILVSGNKANLESVTSLKIDTRDLAITEDGYSNTIDLNTLSLFDDTGINNESGITQIYYEITFPNLAEKSFDMPVEARNEPQGMQANIKKRRVSIVIRGPKDLVEQITQADFSVIVDCTNAKLGETDYPVEVIFDSGFESLSWLYVEDVPVTIIERMVYEDE